jgi:archaetidylinositol phosphate synthase
VAPIREAQRELTFLLAGPERRLLRALAARLPRALHSDHLTALGVLGALGAGTAYTLSRSGAAWLWVASACLVVQWLGDSLDGTLARVRGAERPRYGYYLDHVVDAGATAVIGLGLGLSPYVDLGVALGAVIAYLALSINVYLEAHVFKVFELGYGRIGPTEVRLVLIAANAALAACPPGAQTHLIASTTLAGLGVGMIALLGVRVARNLARLSREEPRPLAVPHHSRRPDPRGSLAPS